MPSSLVCYAEWAFALTDLLLFVNTTSGVSAGESLGSKNK